MLEQALLTGLVVVGHHRQHRIGAAVFRRRGQLDGLQGVVGAGSGNDRHPALDRFDGQLDDPLVLVKAQGGRLAGGAAGDDAVNAAGDLKFDQVNQTLFIDPALVHGGDQCGYSAFKSFHCVLLLPLIPNRCG